MHTVKFRGKEVETPLIRSIAKVYLLGLVLPFCLVFRLVVGRLPKKAVIEFNGRSL